MLDLSKFHVLPVLRLVRTHIAFLQNNFEGVYISNRKIQKYIWKVEEWKNFV